MKSESRRVGDGVSTVCLCEQEGRRLNDFITAKIADKPVALSNTDTMNVTVALCSGHDVLIPSELSHQSYDGDFT